MAATDFDFNQHSHVLIHLTFILFILLLAFLSILCSLPLCNVCTLFLGAVLYFSRIFNVFWTFGFFSFFLLLLFVSCHFVSGCYPQLCSYVFSCLRVPVLLNIPIFMMDFVLLLFLVPMFCDCTPCHFIINKHALHLRLSSISLPHDALHDIQ